MSENEEKVCVFIKKRRNAQIRNKPNDQNDDETPTNSRSMRKKSDSDSDEVHESDQKPGEKRPIESDNENSDTDINENLEEMKRKFQSKQSILTQSTKQSSKKPKEDVTTKFNADKNPSRIGPDDMGATSVFTLDTEFDRDARSIFERAKKIHEEQKSNANDDKVYRGINNYQQFIEKRETAQGSSFNAKGPKRAPANLRVNIFFIDISYFV